MADIYTLPPYESISLERLLNDFTVAQLKDMASSLSLKIKSGLRKAVLVKALSETLLQKPEILINGAFTYELKGWLDIIKGNMTLKEAEDSGLLFALNRFGILYSLRDSDMVYIQPNLANKIYSFLQGEIERREANKETLFEKMAIGCANIYGFVEMDVLITYIEMMCDKLGIEDEDKLNEIINNGLRPVFNIMKITEDGVTSEKPFITPFDCMMDFNIFEHINNKEELKIFDIETVLDFGEMPYPKFNGKYALPLKKEITRHGAKGVKEEHILRKLWLDHQNPYLSPIPNMDFLSFSDISEAQSAINAVMEFQNNVPFWKLRGHSSAEAGRKEISKIRESGRMPHIKMGPGFQAMGIHSFEQLQRMAARGEEFPSDSKVGRNDPCPCGSGKKYKHCCGR